VSLLDRITEAEKGGKDRGRFKNIGGRDALIHTDRSRTGARNKLKGKNFVGRNKRYPVIGDSYASAMGALSQAHQRGQLIKKVSAAVRKKFPWVCPSALSGCPDKRNHGQGGAPEKVSPQKSEHGKKQNWPFLHKKGGPRWDSSWSELGHKDKPEGVKGQKSQPKRMTFKKTKGHTRAQKKELERQVKGMITQKASEKDLKKSVKKGKAKKAAAAATAAAKAQKKIKRAVKRAKRRKKAATGLYQTKKQAAKGKGKKAKKVSP
jgi:hypothetical protein